VKDDRPIITDPVHLSQAAGKAYLCLRPAAAVAAAFGRVQRRLRLTIGTEPASWPAPHLSLKGFGNEETPFDTAMEPRVMKLSREWARSTPLLSLEIEGSDVFAEERIPIIRIRRTLQLSAALEDVRRRAEEAGLPGYEDGVATEDWIFHLSLVYYRGDRWPEVELAMRSVLVQSAQSLVGHAELRAFDGGPERLLGRSSLDG
jgi:hypothetical protein